MVPRGAIDETLSMEKEYVVCPHCGAAYSTERVAMSITAKSPFMSDLVSWTTRLVCSMCKKEFLVSGSYNKVFGQVKR